MDSLAIDELRALVAKARAGTLTEAERQRYEESFRALEHSLLQAQILLAPKDAAARRTFRVVCDLAAEVVFDGIARRGRAQTVSVGGFSVSIPEPPEVGYEYRYTLWFPAAAQPLEGLAVCRASVAQGKTWRWCFEFQKRTPAELARAQLEVVTLVLDLLWPVPKPR
jgi:hypothetical protein